VDANDFFGVLSLAAAPIAKCADIPNPLISLNKLYFSAMSTLFRECLLKKENVTRMSSQTSPNLDFAATFHLAVTCLGEF
jgi:hypothetical protein